jgi:transposase
MDELRRNVEPHRPTQVHLLVDSMESTGVYWKPVWNVLEPQFAIILANAQHIKNVPGRKTDTADCQWIAQLLRLGLLTASFLPPPEIRQLRYLCRTGTSLTR